MGCCKCEEHKWLDKPPLKVAWKDPVDGKEYCVFHAPIEGKLKPILKKKYSVEEFNALVFARIDCAKETGAAEGNEPWHNLAGTVFPGDICFSRYNENNPLPPVCFADATFLGVASFINVHFRGHLSFMRVLFKDKANFNNSKFKDGAHFLWAIFKARAEFAGAEFVGNTNFNITIFHGTASFQGSKFGGVTTFHNATFKSLAIFHWAVAAKDASILMVDITTESLSGLYFTLAELPYFIFRNCSWPDRLSMETNGGGNPRDLLACEELYRAMKQRAAADHDQPQVSHWHYREKRMAMKRGGDNIFDKIMLPLYYATSGFGERAVRAGVWLLALIALSFLANAWTPSWSWNEFLPFANAANATMATIPFAKDIPGEGWVKVGRGLWQLVIAIQFTLFALAVRNRFRR